METLADRVERLLSGPRPLPLVFAGDPVLRIPASAYDYSLPEDLWSELIEAMFQTMRAAPGVGLAAPQIGLGIRVAVLEDAAELPPELAATRQRYPTARRVLVNPRYDDRHDDDRHDDDRHDDDRHDDDRHEDDRHEDDRHDDDRHEDDRHDDDRHDDDRHDDDRHHDDRHHDDQDSGPRHGNASLNENPLDDNNPQDGNSQHSEAAVPAPRLPAAAFGPTAEFYEGCLSVPGYQAVVRRSTTVRLRCSDERGNPVDESVTGWAARIVAHETDHLDGILYLDRAVTRSLASTTNLVDLWAGASMADIRRALRF